MTFHSILFNTKDVSIDTDTVAQPDFFSDLNLDQVIDAVTASKQEYDLKRFFYTPVHNIETIRYRHEVMQDMANDVLMTNINAFAKKMATVRRYLAMRENLDYNYHKEGWLLEAALEYCDTVTQLASDLEQAELTSRGLLAFFKYVKTYARSPDFQTLMTEAQAVKTGLSEVQYNVFIQPGKFSVQKHDGEKDYTIEIENIFAKFKQGAVKDRLVKQYEGSGMNHIDAKILDFVACLHPDQFVALDQFCSAHSQFIDETVRIFDNEIQFYIAYLEFIAPLKRKGLKFCYPHLSATSREVAAFEAFDLALARVLHLAKKPIVCNDFSLHGPERIIVVSGLNQGGKSTFARMFGQLHYLAALGCPVPGREARLFLFDQIFTHFEQEADIRNLRGRLQDDLVRTQHIFAHATTDSILILNEIFSSTPLEDAIFLSKEIMGKVMKLDSLCVWVTFIDQLSNLSEKTISMASLIMPENPVLRTFKIVRQPANGLAYAYSIAEKHRLTYKQIKERIKQ